LVGTVVGASKRLQKAETVKPDRDPRVMVNFTPEDFQVLSRMAEEAETTVSNLLREFALVRMLRKMEEMA
jgi:hypothetical protein